MHYVLRLTVFSWTAFKRTQPNNAHHFLFGFVSTKMLGVKNYFFFLRILNKFVTSKFILFVPSLNLGGPF